MSRVLLIEPDNILAKTYARALESAGYKVEVVSNAQAAVNSADKLQPDVVALELQLVGHSGIEFLYEFRSYTEWQKIPVLLLTSVPPQEFEDNWKLLNHELGVEAYLYKPSTNLDKLVSAIGESLGSQ